MFSWLFRCLVKADSNGSMDIVELQVIVENCCTKEVFKSLPRKKVQR